MKISAVICEFNPIHTGHKRLLDYAKSVSDKVVCIMSGNFVQRGMPACADKYDRARHALLCGADLVVELPTIFATASAQDFAYGGVKIASQLGANYLVFGSECGEIGQLQRVAKMLDEKATNEQIQAFLQQGYSYPKAVSLAVDDPILEGPNNTLAIEYLRAIAKINRKIQPLTIKRENNYNGEGIDFASSSALRKEKTLRDRFTFDFVLPDVDDNIEQKYCDFVCHFLAMKNAKDIEDIAGVSEGIHHKIARADKHLGYDALIEQIKSKRYTRAKLQRILLNCVLGICEDDLRFAMDYDITTKVLAVKSNATTLLQRCDNQTEYFTEIADKLYLSFSGKKPPQKLQKLD